MRALVRLAVERRVTVLMTSLAIAAFGAVGFSRLSLELFPDISYPSLTIQTDFPDTAPQDIETLITQKVEEAVGVLPGLQEIHSVSRSGSSEVTLEFDWGSDMDYLSMEVREKLDRVILPEGADDPIVLRFDPSLDPILRLAIAGRTDAELIAAAGATLASARLEELRSAELKRLRFVGEERLKLDLETLAGVAAAQVRGGLEEEIQIEIDQERLAALAIPLSRVHDVVGASNVNEPGGPLRGEDSQYLIRIVNEFDDLDEIRKLIVRHQDGATVQLAEVADVSWGAREREEITRVDGEEAVEISIYKQADANTVTVAKAVRERVARWQERHGSRERVSVLFDQSGFIQNSVNEVRDAAVIGGVLAILLLLVFLRDFRSTLIVATSIPLSVVATFMVMYRLEISLNIMSLGGLTLGLGMLVDGSIVVLEAIYRRRQRGDSLVGSALEGTVEVGPAVIASTLTTVAVFLPIIFVEGVAGQLFKDQALTVTISLLASLVVAVTLIPMLSAIGRDRAAGSRPAPRAAVAAAPGGVEASEAPTMPAMTLGRFSRGYDRFLRAALARRFLTIGVAVALFIASIASLRFLGTELIPTLSEGEFLFEVNLPEGSTLGATDRIIASMEAAAIEDPTIARTYSTVGTRLVAGGMSLNTKAENVGQLNFVMADRADERAEAIAIGSLRDRFSQIPDLELEFGRPSYFSLETPIEVVIFGENIDELRAHSLELAQRLADIPGLVDIRSSLEAGHPELQVRFRPERVAALGLDQRLLSETVKNRVQGVVATRFRELDRQIDIRIRNLERHRSSKDDVENLVLPGPGGVPIRLSQVADVEHARGPAETHRIEQQRAAVVTANLKGRSLGGAIADVERMLAEMPSPPGFSTELGGQNREMKVSFQSLRFALALAIFLVYLVMASVFESFIHPFIVLLTIPLALIGVVAGLLATDTTVTVIVLIGGVMLVGIVVNNAIVLIDAVNRFRRRGLDKLEAVVRAGHVRLRPILMTTLTTILGLLPMAISWGEGAELRAPLAITVASGLFLSTLLTLVVIPALYLVVPSRVPVASGAGAEDIA